MTALKDLNRGALYTLQEWESPHGAPTYAWDRDNDFAGREVILNQNPVLMYIEPWKETLGQWGIFLYKDQLVLARACYFREINDI